MGLHRLIRIFLGVFVLGVLIYPAPGGGAEQPGDVTVPNLNSTGTEHPPDISGDGSLIVFQSDRPGGVGAVDIYLYDRQVNQIVPLPGLNSPAADFAPTISANGRFIAFASTRRGGEDIYVYDRSSGTLVPLRGLNTRRSESFPILSGDGRFILYRRNGLGIPFLSLLVGGSRDVCLYDRKAQANVSLPSTVKTRDHEDGPALSDDGRFVAFFRERASMFNTELLGDYVFDRQTQQLHWHAQEFRVSDLGADGSTIIANGILLDRRTERPVPLPGRARFGLSARLSHDGRFIVGVTFGNGGDIFLYRTK